jgi:tRNA1(Val) A37 N6-methylase TrmN6
VRSLRQPERGYRFSVDSLILADFAAQGRPARACLDLGTGSGVIALGLLERGACTRATGIECQAELAACARENAATAGLAQRFEVIEGDLRGLRARIAPGDFDLVVANPPFHHPGRGRPSPRPGRATARHEGETRLSDFVAAARHALGARGRFCLVLSAGRLLEVGPILEEHGLPLKRLRLVHPRTDAPARLLLCEARPGRPGGLVIEPPACLTAGSKPGDREPLVR